MAANFTRDNMDAEIQNAVNETADIRANAYIQFHPEINTGRKKLSEQWDQYQLTKS